MYSKILNFILVCSIATVFLISNTRAEDEDGRIVNGQIIDIGRAPFAVQIKQAENGWTFCGGSLITLQYVVTAAHCVTAGIDIVVVGGANTRYDKGVERRVVDMRYPKEYSRTTMYRDIAVLKLDSPMVGDNIGTIRLCSKPWTADNEIRAFGWGRLSDGGDSSDEFRTVSLRSLAHDECLRRLGYYQENTDSMECTFTPNQDFCKGDSGGPGVMNGELCGVVSGNYGCANPNFPSIFTGVYTLRNYIVESVREMSANN